MKDWDTEDYKYMKERLDEVYSIGFKNGQIAMKNKVLKAINRDWSLVVQETPFDIAMKIMKKVNSLKLVKPDLK